MLSISLRAPEVLCYGRYLPFGVVRHLNGLLEGLGHARPLVLLAHELRLGFSSSVLISLQVSEPDQLRRLNVEFEATGVQLVRCEVEIVALNVGQLYNQRACLSEAPVADKAVRADQVAGRPVAVVVGVPGTARARVNSALYRP
jgi:hypothetical protein